MLVNEKDIFIFQPNADFFFFFNLNFHQAESCFFDSFDKK